MRVRRGALPIQVIDRTLKQYADRGVFRGFSVASGRDGRRVYTFTWLTPRPMKVTFHPRANRLSIADMFPRVPARSAMAAELKRVVSQRSTRDVPAHKRIDRRRGSLLCTAHRGSLGVGIVVRGAGHEYAVRYLMNLVNELHLQLHEQYPDYLVAQFGLPPE